MPTNAIEGRLGLFVCGFEGWRGWGDVLGIPWCSSHGAQLAVPSRTCAYDSHELTHYWPDGGLQLQASPPTSSLLLWVASLLHSIKAQTIGSGDKRLYRAGFSQTVL